MIKTKTPRNWGGGIRQVSPPMLTSRLSNIGRWRTNGWKDYSRTCTSSERCNTNQLLHKNSNVWFNCRWSRNGWYVLSVLSNACCVKSRKFGLYWLRRTHGFNNRKCFRYQLHLRKQLYSCKRIRRSIKHSIYSDSFRLILKGVA